MSVPGCLCAAGGWHGLITFCSTFIGNVTIYIYNTYKNLDRK